MVLAHYTQETLSITAKSIGDTFVDVVGSRFLCGKKQGPAIQFSSYQWRSFGVNVHKKL